MADKWNLTFKHKIFIKIEKVYRDVVVKCKYLSYETIGVKLVLARKQVE